MNYKCNILFSMFTGIKLTMFSSITKSLLFYSSLQSLYCFGKTDSALFVLMWIHSPKYFKSRNKLKFINHFAWQPLISPCLRLVSDLRFFLRKDPKHIMSHLLSPTQC